MYVPSYSLILKINKHLPCVQVCLSGSWIINLMSGGCACRGGTCTVFFLIHRATCMAVQSCFCEGMRRDMKAALENMNTLEITGRNGKAGTPTSTNQTHRYFQVCRPKFTHMSGGFWGRRCCSHLKCTVVLHIQK